ncbi:MAG: YdcF family protein [Prosthecobacter sp.]|nr:YdcF family protein [Prosthecobacter sp.]
MKHLFRLTFKRVLVALFALPILLGLAIWGCNEWVERTAHERSYDDVADVPVMDVAVLLGCSPNIAGRGNLFYTYRIEAAVALYRANKVKAFIVSGDNSTHEYDEPTVMKESLIAQGVPEQAIYCDYAGFRTLDSMVRAEAIFDQSKFVVISQRFHNERAVFLARHWGLEVVGFNARDVSRSIGMGTHLREYLARVNAVLDVTLLQTKPKFFGPKVQIKK